MDIRFHYPSYYGVRSLIQTLLRPLPQRGAGLLGLGHDLGRVAGRPILRLAQQLLDLGLRVSAGLSQCSLCLLYTSPSPRD